jgi:signal transduction histidine kinase
LASAGANAIVYRRAGQSQLIELADPVTPDVVATADMRQRDLPSLIVGALDTMFAGPGRTLRIVGEGDIDDSLVEILMPERPLRSDMLDYSRNILLVSLGFAAVTAFALYMLVSQLFILPVQRLTNNILRFRKAPENATLILAPTQRADEIGTLERELSAMESELFTMLRQQRHLADLGLAVAKINHDLRNTLTSAQLLSDQVATLEDPKVQRLAPRLVTTLDRAIGFAQSVLDYGREAASVPTPGQVNLKALIEDAAQEAHLLGHPSIAFSAEINEGLIVYVDAGQMTRVLVNLFKNAREALEAVQKAGEHRISVVATEEGTTVALDISDNGPGLPPRAKENLFVAFEGSARAGGTGLGLAIARELTEANGGSLRYVEAEGPGAHFSLILPKDMHSL